MKQSTSNHVQVSTLAIWAWLTGPGETQTTAAQERTASSAERIDREKLQEKLTEIQREARCIRRAVWIMVFLTSLAFVGLCYSTIFIPRWPQTITQFMMQWTVKAHCVLGLASLSCAIAFSGLDLLYRRKLICHGEEYGCPAGLAPLPINSPKLIQVPMDDAA